VLVLGWWRPKCSPCSQDRVKQIAGPLACVAVTVALVACNGDDEPELRADFLSRFEPPTTGITSCPVIAIHFQDRTTGHPTAWEWTFGDGSASHRAEFDLGDQRGIGRSDTHGERR
jgi:hypothetical protein